MTEPNKEDKIIPFPSNEGGYPAAGLAENTLESITAETSKIDKNRRNNSIIGAGGLASYTLSLITAMLTHETALEQIEAGIGRTVFYGVVLGSILGVRQLSQNRAKKRRNTAVESLNNLRNTAEVFPPEPTPSQIKNLQRRSSAAINALYSEGNTESSRIMRDVQSFNDLVLGKQEKEIEK